MRVSIGVCIVCVIFLLPSQVNAEEMRPVQIDIALNGRGGGESNSFDWNGYVGYAQPLHSLSRRWKIYAAAGVHAGWGSVNQEDRRAVNGRLTMGRYTLGGEARIGLYFGEHSPKFYTFLGGGPTYFMADAISDRLAESGGAGGYRASFGIAWPASWRAVLDQMPRSSCEGGSCVLILFAWLLPNKIQMSYEQIGGTSKSTQRIGGGIGWSF